MRKIKISTPMKTLKNEPITFNEGMSSEELNNLLKDIVAYQISSNSPVQKINEWQNKLSSLTKRQLTVGDYLLNFLSSRFEIKNNKEIFWTNELGSLIADVKNTEIEIDEDKFQFLKRLVENNKFKDLPTGQDKDFLFPYELAQVLLALSDSEKDIKNDKEK